MKQALFALAAVSLAFPVLAQEATPTEEVLSCQQFAALPADQQMTAMSDMEPPPGMEPESEYTVSEEAAEAVMAICEEHPEMQLADAVKQAAAQQH